MRYVAIVDEGDMNDTDFVYAEGDTARLVYPTGKTAKLYNHNKHGEMEFSEGTTKLVLSYSDLRAIILLAKALGFDETLYKLEKV